MSRFLQNAEIIKSARSFESRINKAYRRINDKSLSAQSESVTPNVTNGEDPTLLSVNSVGKRSLNDPNGMYGGSPIWDAIISGKKFRDIERYNADNGIKMYKDKPIYDSQSEMKNSPSILYHGTPSKSFADSILSGRGQIGTRNELGPGFYTTGSANLAHNYSQPFNGNGSVIGLKRPSQIIEQFSKDKRERKDVLKEYNSSNFESPRIGEVIPKNEISGKLFNDVSQNVKNIIDEKNIEGKPFHTTTQTFGKDTSLPTPETNRAKFFGTKTSQFNISMPKVHVGAAVKGLFDQGSTKATGFVDNIQKQVNKGVDSAKKFSKGLVGSDGVLTDKLHDAQNLAKGAYGNIKSNGVRDTVSKMTNYYGPQISNLTHKAQKVIDHPLFDMAQRAIGM